MKPDPEVSSSSGSADPSSDEPVRVHQVQDLELDPAPVWVPGSRCLISGLLGLNVFLLGAALTAGRALNPDGLRDPQVVLLLLLIGVSLVWMLWYLLWARNRPGICPHKDHHAGGTPAISLLVLFAAFSLLLLVCRVGYLMSVRECRPAASLVSPFMEALFLALQTYLLWHHSKDCVHRHKIITRSGLMLLLSCDLLLWLNGVTDDSIHEEIELEKEGWLQFGNTNSSEAASSDLTGNSSWCRCRSRPACLSFRKGFEILHPFQLEFYLMAGCLIYVMWKNVGRRTSPDHPAPRRPTLRAALLGGVPVGLATGSLALVSGVTSFVLYHVWVRRRQLRLAAFLLFYSYHAAVLPVMSLCSLAGLLVYRMERRAHDGGRDPTRGLDALLLLAAALGQLALSYCSLVAAPAAGTRGPPEDLDLSYALLSLLELILQNIFIIEGLHRHPNLLAKKKKKQEKQTAGVFKLKRKVGDPVPEETTANTSAPPAVQEHDGKKPWTKRVTRELCAFLILSNIVLWVIPAFGVHPQFENGLGKRFFGFSVWFVLVNVGQPLAVFYRMHSVAALMELLITA
ncbi:proton channel OTOP3-like [Embiotoca jacksoni]|uniref:proton channel OTOP3-like n=1 Tax=Embiotoca jacksoni TaxID=100190 RepID=UPI003703A188